MSPSPTPRPRAWLPGARRVSMLALATLIVSSGAGAASGQAEAVDRDASRDYPRTIQKVWYRTGTERGFTGRKHSGDLMITRDSLEFLSRKADLSIPADSLRMISYGKMSGDVNTDWVVLSVGGNEKSELVGFRDGRKWGYGQRTPEIFDTLRKVARELGWAQFAAPEGFEPYSELAHVFAIAIPAGWSSLHRDMVGVGGEVVWGTVIFTPRELVSAETGAQREEERSRALQAIRSGQITAWLVKRVESAHGMSCKGFTDNGIATLRRWLAEDALFGGSLVEAAGEELQTPTIDGCRGVRMVLREPRETPPVRQVEVRAVSRDGRTLIVGLLTTEAEYDEALRSFDVGASTLRLAVGP